MLYCSHDNADLVADHVLDDHGYVESYHLRVDQPDHVVDHQPDLYRYDLAVNDSNHQQNDHADV